MLPGIRHCNLNIQGSNHEGEHAFALRMPALRDLFGMLAPDILTLQEFDFRNHDPLRYTLRDYHTAFSPRVGPETHNVIYWRKKRFVKLREHSFYLGNHVGKKEKAWGAAEERAAVIVQLNDLLAKRPIIVVCAHLDQVSEDARFFGLQLLFEQLEQFIPYSFPVAIGIDRNCSPYRPNHTSPSARPVGLFAEHGFIPAVQSAIGRWPPIATYNAYGSVVPDTYGTYNPDDIHVRGLIVANASVISAQFNGVLVSDHNPQLATFEFPPL